MRFVEHCEACPAPCGGGAVTRSTRRVANATLLRFDRYDEPPDSRTETPDPITDNWTMDVCEWLQWFFWSTVRHVTYHLVVGQSPDR